MKLKAGAPGIVLILLLVIYLIYSGWLYCRPEKHNIRNPEKFSKGKTVWQNNNCHVCHQLYGLGGYLGPDLTNVWSRRGEQFIEIFVQNGTGTMPAFRLSKEDQVALNYFLSQVDSTGNADPRSLKINADGTIE